MSIDDYMTPYAIFQPAFNNIFINRYTFNNIGLRFKYEWLNMLMPQIFEKKKPRDGDGYNLAIFHLRPQQTDYARYLGVNAGFYKRIFKKKSKTKMSFLAGRNSGHRKFV